MNGQKQGSTLTSFTLKFIATDGDVESEDKMIIEAQDEGHALMYFDGYAAAMEEVYGPSGLTEIVEGV